MNQEIVDYLLRNKKKYSKEILIEELRKAGHSDANISDAVAFVYGDGKELGLASGLVVSRPEDELRYVGFWTRVAASIIDGLVLCMPKWIVGFMMKFDMLQNTSNFIHTVVSGSFSSLGVFILVLTYTVCMLKNYEATLGKMAMGIRVVSADGNRLTVDQILIRELLGKFVSNLTFGIGYVMAAFTEKKEALHDKIAKTYVVYK